ncbi:MAG: hypothetical protein WCC87_13170 [Candidatus Korobacteraceae bacterium]
MTLWQILTALCFLMPVAFALDAANSVKHSVVGYAVALIVGIIVGVCTAFAMWKVGGQLSKLRSTATSSQGVIIACICLASTLWIGIAGYLGGRSALFVLTHMT